MMRKKYLIILAVLSLVLSAGCSNIPYKIDIEQGNIFTRKEINELSLGMSEDDVKLILGTPMLIDVFHENTWNYITYYKNGVKQEVEQSLLVLTFENGVLTKIDDSQFREIDITPINYEK